MAKVLCWDRGKWRLVGTSCCAHEAMPGSQSASPRSSCFALPSRGTQEHGSTQEEEPASLAWY